MAPLSLSVRYRAVVVLAVSGLALSVSASVRQLSRCNDLWSRIEPDAPDSDAQPETRKSDPPKYVAPPPPPPPAPPAPPPPIPDRLKNMEAFVAAYERANSPQLAVSLWVSKNEKPNAKVALIDQSKFAIIESKLRSVFLHPKVRMSAQEGVLLNAKPAEVQLFDDDMSRIRFVASKTKAELVLLAHLIEMVDSSEATTYTVSYSLVNLRSGAQLGVGSRVLTPSSGSSFTIRDLEEGAYESAFRAATDFVEQYPVGGGRAAAPEAKEAPATLECMDEFVAAYKRAQSPRLLVATQFLRVAKNDERANLLDAGIMRFFEDRIRQSLQHSEVRQTMQEAQKLLTDERQLALLRNDEVAAAQILGEKTNAQLVLIAKLTEQPRPEGSSYIASYRLVDMRRGFDLGADSELIDPVEGRIPDRDLKWAGYRVAAKAARNLIAAFPPGIEGRGRQFSVRLMGTYSDDDLQQFQDTLKSIRGVNAESVHGEESKVAGKAVLTYDLDYWGDPIVLRHAVRRAAMDRLGMEAEIIEAREGSIDIRLKVKPPLDREQFLSGGDLAKQFGRNEPRLEEAKKEREALADLYAKSGRPVVAVMINRAATHEEMNERADELKKSVEDNAKLVEALAAEVAKRIVPDAAKESKAAAGSSPESKRPESGTGSPPEKDSGASQSGGVTVVVRPQIIVGDFVNAGERQEKPDSEAKDSASKPADQSKADDAKAAPTAAKNPEEVLDTRMMEDRIVNRLVSMQIRSVDMTEAEQIVKREQKFQEQFFGERELALLMGRVAKAQIIVSGVGRIIREESNKPRAVRYTFRAVRVSDAMILGTATVERDFEWPFKMENLDEIAGEAVGKLMAQMMDSWRPPQMIEVTIANASQRRVQEIMDLIEQRFRVDSQGARLVRTIRQMSYEAGKEGGYAVVRVEFETDPNKLKAEILRANDLPFELEGYQENEQTMRIKVK